MWHAKQTDLFNALSWGPDIISCGIYNVEGALIAFAWAFWDREPI